MYLQATVRTACAASILFNQQTNQLIKILSEFLPNFKNYFHYLLTDLLPINVENQSLGEVFNWHLRKSRNKKFFAEGKS